MPKTISITDNVIKESQASGLEKRVIISIIVAANILKKIPTFVPHEIR
jgi:hypothetical protein